MDGENIYLTAEQAAEPLSDNNANRRSSISLHPNMPFVVILLTPFSYLPMWAGGLLFTILKVLVVFVAFFWSFDPMVDGVANEV